MNYTENYQFPQWEESDRVLMEDFNTAMRKMDNGIASTGNAYLAYGTYTGTGEYGADAPCTLDFSNVLSGVPKLLLVRPMNGVSYQILALRGMATTFLSPNNSYSNEVVHLTWTDTGVSWYVEKSAMIQLNDAESTYFYLALA